MLGKLKKTTQYIKFDTPLYILPLNVAKHRKRKDKKRLIRDLGLNLGLNLGYKVLLKQKNMKGVIKFIGQVHFTYGFVVGLEMSGNGNGNMQLIRIKYNILVVNEMMDYLLELQKHIISTVVIRDGTYLMRQDLLRLTNDNL